MAKTKRRRKGKQKPSKPKRQELRFTPERTHIGRLHGGVGMVGAVVLGAGVWAQWLSVQAYGFAPYLVAGGALALAAAIWSADLGATPVRVGDAGVAIEKGSELVRLAWCDMERVSVYKGVLVIQGGEVTLKLPMGAHPKATAWVLAEGTRRMPEVMDVKPSVVDTLPEPRKDDGEWRNIAAVQITGRLCAVTDQAISFERDARVCPNCAQVYHKDHVPPECVTCQGPLGGNAVAV